MIPYGMMKSTFHETVFGEPRQEAKREIMKELVKYQNNKTTATATATKKETSG